MSPGLGIQGCEVLVLQQNGDLMIDRRKRSDGGNGQQHAPRGNSTPLSKHALFSLVLSHYIAKQGARFSRLQQILVTAAFDMLSHIQKQRWRDLLMSTHSIAPLALVSNALQTYSRQWMAALNFISGFMQKVTLAPVDTIESRKIVLTGIESISSSVPPSSASSRASHSIFLIPITIVCGFVL